MNTSTFTWTPTNTPTLTPTNTITNTSTAAWTLTFTNSPTLTATPVGTPVVLVSQVINPSQAATVVLSGGATISIPANSLTQPVTLTVSQYASGSAPATATAFQISFLPYVYVIDTGGVEPQAGASVTITLPYNPADIPSGYTAADLTITYFDGTNWITLASTLDTVNHILTVVTNHFSWWAAVLVDHSPTPTRTFTPSATGGVTFSGTQPLLYPNPATGNQVNIGLPSLKAAGNVTVRIYTLAFRKAQELVVPNVQPGESITLDLLDKWGARLSNGLYYVEVILPDGTKTILRLLVQR
jgi:hypothetical protein